MSYTNLHYHIVFSTKQDHLHLLTSLSPKTSLVDILRNIKANSSKWIHQTYPDLSDFAWQDGYSAFTVSQSGIDSVTQYIANQVEHHQNTSSHDELVTLLKRHEIDYDERYIIS